MLWTCFQSMFSPAEQTKFEKALNDIYSSVISGGSGIEAYMTHSRELRERFCIKPRYFEMWRTACLRKRFIRAYFGRWQRAWLRERFIRIRPLEPDVPSNDGDIEPKLGGTFLKLTGGSADTNSGDDSVPSDEDISEDGTEQSDPDYVPNPADGDPSEKETSDNPLNEKFKVRMGIWKTIVDNGRHLLRFRKLDTLIKIILDYAQQRNVNETNNYGYQRNESQTAEQVLAAMVADIPDDRDFYGVYFCLRECDHRSQCFQHMHISHLFVALND